MLLSALLSLTIIIPGLLVLANRRSGYREWLFLALSAFLALWVFTNYLVDHDSVRALFWTRSTFFSIVWACFFFLEFTLRFPEKLKFAHIWRFAILGSAIIVSLLTYSKLFITGTYLDQGVVAFNPGSLYTVFLFYYPTVLILAFIILVRSYFRAKSIAKLRVGTVLFSLFIMTVITSTTNLLLPQFFGYTGLAPYGGYATVIFTVGVAYAMLRHHLFDIRAVAARTSAYVMSVGLIVGTYSIVAISITNVFSVKGHELASQRIIFIIFVSFVAILFQPIKKFFDKVTNKIFYRDNYDPQVVLDKLSDQLVGTLELDQLLSNSTELISDAMKSVYCMILLSNHSTDRPRIFGNKPPKHLAIKVGVLLEGLESRQQWPIIADELEDLSLKKLLHSLGISYVTDMTTKTEKLGYMILGEKKNGNIYSADDSSLLSIMADELALGLENALRFEQIEDFNLNLQQKIDHATIELRRSNQKLQALDEAKDEFISMASHQLRTPLTSIKGYLSMVLEGDVGEVSPQQKSMLTTAYMSSQRMVYLISDLLNVSRLQTGKFVIEPVPTYLPDIVEQELDQLRESITAKNITLVYDKPTEFATVMLDETKIRQVIMNFADNALYYTPAGGRVELALKESAKSVEFTVTDTGIGVPKGEQHKLFTKFYRAANARTARPDGTGLGLFMAKKVILASGGALIFKTKEGKGSTFGFIFPKK